MFKSNSRNISNLSYNTFFNSLNNFSLNQSFSLICFDPKFNNDNILLKLLTNNVIQELFVITNNNIDVSMPNLFIYNKINKNIKSKFSTKNTFICVNTDTIDNDKTIKITIKWLINLTNTLKNKNISYNIVSKDFNTYYHYIYNTLTALLFPDKKSQYEFIYDTVCNQLDDEFIKNNYCDFKNNICIAKRPYPITQTSTMGCCHTYRKGMFLGKLGVCKYLENKKCTAQCITCKLFTCDKIQFKFEIKNIFLLNCFFNPIQKLIIETSFFTEKDKIIKRLLLFTIN